MRHACMHRKDIHLHALVQRKSSASSAGQNTSISCLYIHQCMFTLIKQRNHPGHVRALVAMCVL